MKKYIPAILTTLALLGFTVVYNGNYFEVVKQIEIFTTLYKKLNTSYVDELNHGKLMTTAIDKMLEQVDPYTVFYNEQDNLSYSMRQNKYRTESGMRFVFKDEQIFVKNVDKNGSADKAGLKSGDEIIKIDDTSVKDFGFSALNLLKSPGGTKINITYKRRSQILKAELVMTHTKHSSVPFFKMIDGNIAYIILTEFSKTAAAEVEQALKILKIEGAKSVVLDLRNNPGGLLDQAVDIINLFVPKKQLIVTTKSRIESQNNAWYTKKDPLDTEIPIVVLINESSASASEIVSGSLQDLDRGVLVGSRSFGKGLVQIPMKLVYGTQLKVTVSRYYTPSGRCIQKLDYTHRDKKGKAKQITHRNVFKTKSGRPIYDGGGITPDVTFSKSYDPDYLKKLRYNPVIFDFAVQYGYSHPNMTLSNFKDANFEDFKSFFDKYDDTPKTDLGIYLKKQLKQEKLSETLERGIRDLLQKIKSENLKNLDKNKEGVEQLLTEEILSDLFYKEDIYNYALKNDKAIKKAVDILKNPKTYRSILTP